MNLLKKIRWWHWIGIVLFLLVILGVVKHLLAVARWEAYAGELRKQGVAMEFAALKFPRPEGENGLPELTLLAEELPSDLTMPATLRQTEPGVVLVAWQQPETYDAKAKPLSTNLWGELRLAALAHQAVTAKMQAALEKPVLFEELKYADGFDMEFGALVETKKTVRWFVALAELEAYHGRHEAALEYAVNAVMVPEKTRGQRTLVGQLVRLASLQIGASVTWELLQANAWNSAQLGRLQEHWENTDPLAEWEGVWAVERLFSQEGIRMFQSDYSALHISGGGDRWEEFVDLMKDVTSDPKGAAKGVYGRYPAYWSWVWWHSYDDLISAQERFQEIGQVTRMLQSNGVFAVVAPALEKIRTREEGELNEWESDVLTERRMETGGTPYSFGRLGKTMAIRQLAITALALARFRAEQGAYPERLEELVPAFLARPPLDPMDGKLLRYKKLPGGGFQLYSIGMDLRDDGGSAVRAGGAWEMFELEAFAGQDIIWPRAATAAEVEAWRNRGK